MSTGNLTFQKILSYFLQLFGYIPTFVDSIFSIFYLTPGELLNNAGFDWLLSFIPSDIDLGFLDTPLVGLLFGIGFLTFVLVSFVKWFLGLIK